MVELGFETLAEAQVGLAAAHCRQHTARQPHSQSQFRSVLTCSARGHFWGGCGGVTVVATVCDTGSGERITHD